MKIFFLLRTDYKSSKIVKTLVLNIHIFTLQFRLMLSHDGSGKGAALVAAVAHRVEMERKNLENQMQDLNVS